MEGLAKGRVLLSGCMVELVYAINGCGTDSPVETDTPTESPPSHQFFTAGTRYRLDIRFGSKRFQPPEPSIHVLEWVQERTLNSADPPFTDTMLVLSLHPDDTGLLFRIGIPCSSVHISDAGYDPVFINQFEGPARLEGLALELVVFLQPGQPCGFPLLDPWPPPNRNYTITVIN